MAISDILGQDAALKILRGSMIRDRISHAYLFHGDDGIGKKMAAVNFAKLLNCMTTPSALRGLDDDPDTKSVPHPAVSHNELDCCDRCASCLKTDRGTHPDVFTLTPEDGQIKVHAIRSLGESLSYKPFEGKWKVAVVDSAESLNQSAANAFLKTLEEPPEQSIIILISAFPDLIPATIRSRCQAISFSPLPLEMLKKILQDFHASDGSRIRNNQAMLLSLLSGGRPGWAMSGDLMEKRDRVFAQFQGLLHAIDEDLWPDRESMEEWYDWVELWFRDVAVFRATGEKNLLINQDKNKEIHDIAQRADLRDILKLYDTLYNMKKNLRFNLNKQITLYTTYIMLKNTFRREGCLK